jgi:hypothetical protein
MRATRSLLREHLSESAAQEADARVHVPRAAHHMLRHRPRGDGTRLAHLPHSLSPVYRVIGSFGGSTTKTEVESAP